MEGFGIERRVQGPRTIGIWSLKAEGLAPSAGRAVGCSLFRFERGLHREKKESALILA
jgi:hypothetical protein